MSLANLIRKREPKAFATATPATFATQLGERAATVARVATVAVANSPEGKTAIPESKSTAIGGSVNEPIEQGTFCEDFPVDRIKYNLPTVPDDDDRRTCDQCLNLRMKVCTIAAPGAMVSANRGYRPDPARLLRCAGYAPMANETDKRPGAVRWPYLNPCVTQTKKGLSK